jgi:hypothetical protein
MIYLKSFIMKKSLFLLFLFCNFIGSTVANPILQENIKLQLKPGDKHLVHFENDQSIHQEVMGQSVQVNISNKTELLFEMVSKTADLITLKVTYQNIYMNMDLAGMQTFIFDSKNVDESSIEFAGMKDLLNRTLTVTVNNAGKVQEITGFEGVEIVSNEFFKGGENALNDGLKQLVEQITHIFPTKSIKIGESYEIQENSTIAGVVQAKLTNHFTLKSKQANKLLFDVDGIMNLSDQGENMQGATFNLKGNSKGTLDLDAKTGMINNYQYSQDTKGTIEVQGMSIPFQMTSKAKIYSSKL